MPRLYKVIKDGGPFKLGAFVEEGDDGMVQEVYARQEGGRLKLGGYKGLVFPMSVARHYLFRVQSGGLDEYHRRAY